MNAQIFTKPTLGAIYYEEKNGSFGVRFPAGIEAGELLKRMRERVE